MLSLNIKNSLHVHYFFSNLMYLTYWYQKSWSVIVRGLAFSLEGGPKITKKVATKNCNPLILMTKNSTPPSLTHIFKIHSPPNTDIPYPLNRLNCTEISIFEQNKHTTYGHLVTLHFGHQKFYDLPIFSENYDPSVFETPFQRRCQPPDTLLFTNLHIF